MRRSLLAVSPILVAAVTAGCTAESTFTRQCYEVPHEIVETAGDTVVLETGVRYVDTFVGNGTEVRECTDVFLHYSGELADGTHFDSGSFTFVPGQAMVIAGFEQGVMTMREEGVRRIIIPPELAYGDKPQTGADGTVIPANSTLIFDVEIGSVME